MTDLHRRFRSLLRSSPVAYALAGAVGAAAGWAALEPFFQEGGCSGRVGLANAFFFPTVMGAIAAALAAVDSGSGGRFPDRLCRAIAAFGPAFAVAYVLLGPCHILFTDVNPSARHVADFRYPAGAVSAIMARSLTWGLIGLSIGVGVWVAGGGKAKSLGATSGALVGGIMGGMLFDPIQELLQVISIEAPWGSRITGFALEGGVAGFMAGVATGIVSSGRVAVLSGPLSGRVFLLDSRPRSIGSSQSCDLMLGGDPLVQSIHLVIHKAGFAMELQCASPEAVTTVNHRVTWRTSLLDGDRIKVGKTELAFFSCGSDRR
ncbi:MAG: hypothetical protein HY914_03480 [Desulfomonile tiedjei]|nr:hypothetical protein [Desulfomonile tiedjei]